MGIFDIMGPVMIGPSSSHTAGASKIGFFAAVIYSKPVKEVEITLFNSFAETGVGHGTHKAVIGGLLGMRMDDERLKNSFAIADERGMKYKFTDTTDPDEHPNRIKIRFIDLEGDFEISGISAGGGRIQMKEIDGTTVDFSGQHDILYMNYIDKPGMLGFIGDVTGKADINIAYMHISRDANTGITMALLKLDSFCEEDVVEKLRGNSDVISVKSIPRLIS